MSNELLIVCDDQKLSDDLYSALSADYSLRKHIVGGLPTLNEIKSISPLLILIEANLFDAVLVKNPAGYMAGYKTLIYGGEKNCISAWYHTSNVSWKKDDWNFN